MGYRGPDGSRLGRLIARAEPAKIVKEPSTPRRALPQAWTSGAPRSASGVEAGGVLEAGDEECHRQQEKKRSECGLPHVELTSLR